MLYCPFTHHVMKRKDEINSAAYICGLKAMNAAIDAVHTAEALNDRGLLHEGTSLHIEVLVMATMTLLAIELGAPDNKRVDAVKASSMTARLLLETLAQKNYTATQCLQSLAVSLIAKALRTSY